MTFRKGDKLVVSGLNLPLVFVRHLGNGEAKVLIEGESEDRIHSVIYARVTALLPNNSETLRAEKQLLAQDETKGNSAMTLSQNRAVCAFLTWIGLLLMVVLLIFFSTVITDFESRATFLFFLAAAACVTLGFVSGILVFLFLFDVPQKPSSKVV